MSEPKQSGQEKQQATPLYLDSKACSLRYAVSQATWRRLVDCGKAPPPRRFGRLIRWPVKDLDEWDAAGNSPVRQLKGGRQ